MKKLRIAQIGIGHDHADDIFFSLCKLSDYYEVVGYALPPEEENSSHFRKRADETFVGYPQFSVEELLSDPTIQAVTVETEERNLSNYALLAAKSGKHIHMDKPGGMEPAVFEELIETMRKQDLTFHTGYMYRYNPAVQELLAKVKNGDLGDIFSVEAHMSGRHSTNKRRWIGTLPGGMTFFLGCHLIDLILLIQGAPERVIPLNKATGADGVDSLDYGMAVLEYKNGISFAKACDMEVGGFDRRQLVVSGTKGTIRLMPLEMVWDEERRLDLYTDVTEYTGMDWFNRGTTTRTAPYDRYDNMMTSFGQIALGQKENAFSYDHELLVYRTLMKCCGVM